MKPKGPLIFIGLPAATRASSGAQYYRPPAELTAMYQVGQYRTSKTKAKTLIYYNTLIHFLKFLSDAEPQTLKYSYPVLQSVKNLPGIGGIMLWDVSWDQNNVINGQRYSDYAFKELGGVTEPPTQAPPPTVTTQAPPPPITTHDPCQPVTTEAPPPPITTQGPPTPPPPGTTNAPLPTGKFF